MIKHFTEEPLLKKILVITLISLVIVLCINLYIHFIIINSIHKQYISFSQEMVGKMVELVPEKENEIVKTFLYKGNSELISKGKDILNKYGYETEIRMWQDPIFRKHFYNFEFYDLFTVILLIAIFIVILLCIFSYFTKKIEKVSRAIDSIMDENFQLDLEENTEGIFSELSSRLQQMSKKLKYSFINLKKEKEEIKSLVTDISHQVKTPLASIKLFNSLLIDDDLSKKETEEFLLRSREEINKLEWLFNSLVKISRMEVGMIELKKELRDIKQTLLQSISEIYIKAQEKDISIDIKKILSVPAYHDPKWTKEAIFNILENSVKYTHNHGYIHVSVEQMETYIRIDIKDSGIGIPEKEFNDIFKRFYRGKSHEVKNCQGSGVGLYLTRKIFQEQGGSVMVDSIQGRGSKFSLYLQNCK